MSKENLDIEITTKSNIKDLQKTNKALEKTATISKTSSQKIKGLNTSLVNLSTGLQAGYVAIQGMGTVINGIKQGVGVFADYEASIKKLGAVSGATKEELASLDDTAKNLGASTRYSASQVSEAMNYLAMAGLKTKDINASIGDVLNLATIGATDLGTAADIASNILSGFGKNASELGNVVDIMSATITNSNTSIEQMGEAMKYVAPVAKSMGIDIEDVATAIGVLGNAGLQGSIAGTSLAQMLQGFSGKTPQAIKLFKELGISVYDSSGKFVGLNEALVRFKAGIAGLTDHEKQDVIRKIFGTESAKSVITLLDNVGTGFDELSGKIEKSAGLGQKLADQMDKGLTASFKGLNSAIESKLLDFFKELSPVIEENTKKLTEFVRGLDAKEMGEFAEGLAELASNLGNVLGLFADFTSVLSTLSDYSMPDFLTGKEDAGIFTTAIQGYQNLADGIKQATEASKDFGKSIDYELNIDEYQEKYKQLGETLSNEAKVQVELGIKSDSSEEVKAQIKSTMQEIEGEIKLFQQNYSNILSTDQMNESIAPLQESFKKLFTSYKALDGLKPFDSATASANELKNATEDIKNIDVKVNADASEAKTAIEEVKNQNPTVEVDVKANTQNAQTEIQNLNTVNQSVKVPTEADTTQAKNDIANLVNVADVKVDVKADTTKLKSDVKDITGKKTLSVKATANIEKAKKAISELTKDTNSTHSVKVNASQALATIASLKKPTSSTHTIYIKRVEKKSGGGVVGLATGGFLRRRGKIFGHDTNGSDDVKAMLTRGEFVQNVSAVDYYGVDFMEKLNRKAIPKRQLQHLASGGLVLNEWSKDVLKELTAQIASSQKSTSSSKKGGVSPIGFGDDQIKAIKQKIATYASAQDIEVPSKIEASKDYPRLNQYLYALMNRKAQIEALNKTLTKKTAEFKKMFTGIYTASQSERKNRLQEISTLQYNIKNAKIPAFAKGGLIGGGVLNGYGGGDRRLAFLEDGEGVIRKEAMRRLGTAWLDNVNSLAIPKYAKGGAVGGSKNVNLNFTLGDGQIATTQTDEQTAQQITNYLKRYAQ